VDAAARRHRTASQGSVKALPPRPRPEKAPTKMWLSGLEDFTWEGTYSGCGLPFVNLGERCNIAGSRKFKRPIVEGEYDEVMDIARDQVEAGAHIIDINVDDGMIGGLATIQMFVKMAVSKPDVAKIPLMIDPSKIVEDGLK